MKLCLFAEALDRECCPNCGELCFKAPTQGAYGSVDFPHTTTCTYVLFGYACIHLTWHLLGDAGEEICCKLARLAHHVAATPPPKVAAYAVSLDIRLGCWW